VDLDPRVRGSASFLVSEPRRIFFAFCSRERRNFTMPPRRRDRQTPDPPEEREIPRRRGRQVPNPAMEREMHVTYVPDSRTWK
jgi:hypothetical protein